MTISSPDFRTPQQLLRIAEEILVAGQVGRDQWTFGGGTALSIRIHHRESRDIDIFLQNAQHLTMITPRLNATAERVSSQYDESSSHVKIRSPSGIDGEIDFILSPILTRPGAEELEMWDGTLRVETGAEIIAKKLFHRAANFTGRDIFDLAAFGCDVQDPGHLRLNSLKDSAPVFASKISAAGDRIEKLRNSGIGAEEIARLRVASSFEGIARVAHEISLGILGELEKI